MYILINNDGALSLEQADDMNGFSIVDKSNNSDLSALLEIAEPAEDNHYWLNADSVISLSPEKGDSQWVKDFWDMLSMVEKYGYSDLGNRRVKAHIEQKE